MNTCCLLSWTRLLQVLGSALLPSTGITGDKLLSMHRKWKDTQHKIHEKEDYLGTTGLINILTVWRENQLLLFDVFDHLCDQVPRWWWWGTTMARQHLQGRHPSVSRLETLSNCWREIPTPRGGRYLSILPLHKLCPALPWKFKRVRSQKTHFHKSREINQSNHL